MALMAYDLVALAPLLTGAMALYDMGGYVLVLAPF